MSENKTKIGKVIGAADSLSLGISIVVAVLMGVGIGLLFKKFTGLSWTLWIGVFWGISAAILNVYKVYKSHSKELEKLKDRFDYSQKDEDED